MREIKFRAWLTLEKEMLYDFTTFTDHYTDDFNNTIKYHQENDLVLMQYTGLKDKNGVEIFEGDIVKEVIGGEIAYVVYKKGSCSFTLEYKANVIGDGLHYDSHIEIIGNIYENKELIK